MTDITRDDLYVRDGSLWDAEVHQVTDEEFDRLVLERIREIPGKVLRALLTDECEECDNGWVDAVVEFHECPVCGGRGWLPKDGVYRVWWCAICRMTEYKPSCSFGHTDGQWMLVHPADWLEAEDG